MNWLWLWDTSEFLTRGHGGMGWAPWLRQTYQLANYLIWFSYLVIAVQLFRLYRSKKSELPAPGLFVLGTMFLLFCGLSHLGNVVAFFWAPYRLFTLIDLVTAGVAVAAACRIPGAVHGMVQLPAREYVRSFNKALEESLTQTARKNQELVHRYETLKERNRALEQMLKTNAWIREKIAVVEELNKNLSDRELA